MRGSWSSGFHAFGDRKPMIVFVVASEPVFQGESPEWHGQVLPFFAAPLPAGFAGSVDQRTLGQDQEGGCEAGAADVCLIRFAAAIPQ
jgi:hypothetical protein